MCAWYMSCAKVAQSSKIKVLSPTKSQEWRWQWNSLWRTQQRPQHAFESNMWVPADSCSIDTWGDRGHRCEEWRPWCCHQLSCHLLTSCRPMDQAGRLEQTLAGSSIDLHDQPSTIRDSLRCLRTYVPCAGSLAPSQRSRPFEKPLR